MTNKIYVQDQYNKKQDVIRIWYASNHIMFKLYWIFALNFVLDWNHFWSSK